MKLPTRPQLDAIRLAGLATGPYGKRFRRGTYTGIMPNSKKLIRLLAEAKRLAKQYYRLTERPLGVTGEVAEYEAIRLLHLRPAAVRQPGYDAEGKVRNGRRERLQIKGRCFPGKINPGARMGAIDLSKPWDAVLLVLLDSDFDATAIYRAERAAVRAALLAPGSKSRNERSQLPISKFKAIGRCVWPSGHNAITPT